MVNNPTVFQRRQEDRQYEQTERSQRNFNAPLFRNFPQTSLSLQLENRT